METILMIDIKVFPKTVIILWWKQLLKVTEVVTSIDFNKNRENYEKFADKIVYTGKIDDCFGFKFGKLQYRTVRWENEIKDMENYQGEATINYPR